MDRLSARPELMDEIAAAATSNQWVSFFRRTFDGWYCVPVTDDEAGFAVYYQEKGQIFEPVETFHQRAEAMASVLIWSGVVAPSQ